MYHQLSGIVVVEVLGTSAISNCSSSYSSSSINSSRNYNYISASNRRAFDITSGSNCSNW